MAGQDPKMGITTSSGVHRIAERMIERFPPPSEHTSQEGGALCRAFVVSSVQSIYAEEKLRQHFEKHPCEARSYKDFWPRIT
jgi:hypothetical protein